MNKHNQQKRQLTYTVEEPAELLAFMLEQRSGSSRKSVKSMLTRGQFQVNGEVVTQYNYLLQPGQVVSIGQSLPVKAAAFRFNGLEILFEDQDIIVIDKAAGLLSVAGKNLGENTAYRQLNDYVKSTNHHYRIFVVHRLDRDTSGVMVYAKNEHTKNQLQENWQDVVKERTYTTVVEGIVRQDKGTIKSWLTVKDSMRVHSSPYDNGGKYAVTHYKKIKNNRRFSLLEVELETGRKNQIRVHMSEIKHPVLGDKKYGAKSNLLRRLALHATTLAFIHPTSQELVRFTSPVPPAFFKTVR
ncbi:RluA family pseudouridine synthase [Aerococcaceae bacterium WGS1372]